MRPPACVGFGPLAAATVVGMLVILWGALFLIAPVYQPGYGTVGYVAPSMEETAGQVWPININTADASELMRLDGVGEAKAQAIIRYRRQYGLFAHTDELEKVPGISARMVESWAGLITVDDGP